MRVWFDKKITGVEGWHLKPGSVVEVLSDDNFEIKGEFCIVAKAEETQLFLVSLKTGEVITFCSNSRFRLMDAELVVRNYEGRWAE